METTFKSMRGSMPRFMQGCVMACAVPLLPVGLVDAKPAKKKPCVEKAAAERKRAQEIYTSKIAAWDKKLKTAVKDGIITEKESRVKMTNFKKKLTAEKLAAEKKAAADKKAAAKKAGDKKRAEKQQAVKKQPDRQKADKKKPEPMTAAQYAKKVRKEVKAGKLTKKEGREKVSAYRKKMEGCQKKEPKAASRKKKK